MLQQPRLSAERAAISGLPNGVRTGQAGTTMMNSVRGIAAKAAWAAALAGLSLSAATLEDFGGKWTTKRVTENGDSVTMTMQFDGAKLAFRILDGSGDTRLFAKTKVKLEKFGPFEALRFYDIEAGGSPDDTQPVDDERVSVVQIDGETFRIAGNFDKRRDNESPNLDTYTRTEKPAKPTAAATADSKLKGRWRLTLTTGDDTSHGILALSQQGGNWTGSYTNAEGEQRDFKVVQVKGDDLHLEIDGEIDNNSVTFVSKAKLVNGKLIGSVTVKGREGEEIGKWTAEK